MIVDALVWLAVAGLTAIGAGAIFAPVALSRLYGAPVVETNAIVYVRAAGVRDVLLAVALAYAEGSGFYAVATVLLALGAVLALADLILTLAAVGWHVRREHLAHVGGFVGFAALVYLSMQR